METTEGEISAAEEVWKWDFITEQQSREAGGRGGHRLWCNPSSGMDRQGIQCCDAGQEKEFCIGQIERHRMLHLVNTMDI